MELILENITKKYGKKIALDNISLTLTNGVYGLLGPNGAGKSTLINIIVDLLEPTNGRVVYNGKNIRDKSVRYVEKLGYLPQYPRFYKNFRTDEFLEYMAVMKGIPKNNIKSLVKKLLDDVNLTEDARRKIGQFSGGMRQRLGIAQAIINEPEILILDEPTAGLDPKERIRFRNIISRLSAERIVILATHIVNDIEYIAKEVLLLRSGKLIRKATSEELMISMDGMVWLVPCEINDIDNWMNKYSITNAVMNNDMYELRIVSDEKPTDNSRKAIPNLEDVYLYYFGESYDKS